MGLPEGSWRYCLEIAAGYWLAAVLVLLELAVGSCRLGIGGIGWQYQYWVSTSKGATVYQAPKKTDRNNPSLVLLGGPVYYVVSHCFCVIRAKKKTLAELY